MYISEGGKRQILYFNNDAEILKTKNILLLLISASWHLSIRKSKAIPTLPIILFLSCVPNTQTKVSSQLKNEIYSKNSYFTHPLNKTARETAWFLLCVFCAEIFEWKSDFLSEEKPFSDNSELTETKANNIIFQQTTLNKFD